MLDASIIVVPASRRTRKRFTNAQLTMLENLFHRNSHPSRQDREALASAGGMEIKSVTIWFQNKRQTERKSAASNTPQANTFNEHNVHPNITSTIHTFSLHSNDLPSTTSPVSTRPSLDRVASRSQLRTPSSHSHHPNPLSPQRLPTFPPSNQPSLYDHLPSSPLFPSSPQPSIARDFIEFGRSSSNAKTRRTLEWACEAARIADRDKERVRDRDCHSHPDPSSSTSSMSAVNPGYHRHHAHHLSHQQLSCASADAFPSGLPSSRNRSAAHRDRSHISKPSHRRDPPPDRSADRLPRPSSSLTLRARRQGSASGPSSARGYTGPLSDSEQEEEQGHHEAATPPTPGISHRWTGRLTKTSTSTSLSSTSTTPSTSTSISREGSATSTNTSFTSLNSGSFQAEDDAMFKAALALCGLGRAGQSQRPQRGL